MDLDRLLRDPLQLIRRMVAYGRDHPVLYHREPSRKHRGASRLIQVVSDPRMAGAGPVHLVDDTGRQPGPGVRPPPGKMIMLDLPAREVKGFLSADTRQTGAEDSPLLAAH